MFIYIVLDKTTLEKGIMQIFNPFKKSFEDVKEEDLEVLKSVAEGWHIEYKREKPNGKSIAKSIASFANSYGGIYFIGIDADKATNMAISFDGVSDSPEVIRDAISNNLQPFPYFNVYLIPLSNNKSVIMVVVYEGESPPYIHSSGKIYRRQEAASDPISENNRYTIDELYVKAKNMNNEIELFRNLDISFNKEEERNPSLEMYINTVPFKTYFIMDFLEKENFERIEKYFLNQTFIIGWNYPSTDDDFSASITCDIGLDTLHTYATSICVRALKSSGYIYNGLTIEIDMHGNLKMYLPLNALNTYSESIFSRYENIIKKYGHSIDDLRVLDARGIIAPLMGVFYAYNNFLSELGYKDNVDIKMRLNNCYRSTLFIDSNVFFTHIEKYGIPINMKDSQYFPPYPIKLETNREKLSPIMQGFALFCHMAVAFGVPIKTSFEAMTEEIVHKKKV